MDPVAKILEVVRERQLRIVLRADGKLAFAGPKSTVPLRSDPLIEAVRSYRAEIIEALKLEVPAAALEPVELLLPDGAVILAPDGWQPANGSPGRTGAMYWRRRGELAWETIPLHKA